MLKFTVRNKKTGKEESLEVEGEQISVGRNASNQIVLDSKTVSRKHCEIVKIKKDYFLVDLGSGNGTFLNALRLKANERTPLASPAVIRIEEFEIEPVLPPPGQEMFQEEDTDSGIIEIRMIKKVLGALESEQSPALEVLSPPAEGKKIFFTDDLQELVIGRDPECQLVIDSGVISRKHAVLQKKWGGITITDLKSKNGTFVNNQRVEEKQLQDGDPILLGNIQIVFRNPQEIDLNALSKEYEEKEKEVEPVEKEKMEEPSTVSEEAKLSLDPPLEKTVEPEEEEPGPPPPRVEAIKSLPPKKKIGLPFSKTEFFLMGIGIIVFVSALIALLTIL